MTTDNVFTKNWFAMVTLPAWTTQMKKIVTALLLSLFVQLENVSTRMTCVIQSRAARTNLTNPDVVGKGCFWNALFSWSVYLRYTSFDAVRALSIINSCWVCPINCMITYVGCKCILWTYQRNGWKALLSNQAF